MRQPGHRFFFSLDDIEPLEPGTEASTMSERTILVAGIGNIFLGDDGFGVEVAQQLAARPQPDGVRVADYGIRGFDLAFALLDEPEATILIDAMPRGQAPGTVYVLEPDLDGDATPATPDHAEGSFQGHAMTPDFVFALVRTLGGTPAQRHRGRLRTTDVRSRERRSDGPQRASCERRARGHRGVEQLLRASGPDRERDLMHELGLAEGILTIATDMAGERPVTRIVVRIGEEQRIVPDSLEFGFQLLAEGTVCEGASLRCVVVPGIDGPRRRGRARRRSADRAAAARCPRWSSHRTPMHIPAMTASPRRPS